MTRTAVVASILLGVLVGMGAYTFVYAKGYSYLIDRPAACANCHVMGDHYRAWTRSSHRSVAGCNDCHTPPGLVPKYAAKARNGFWHSLYFTTGRHPDPLRINARNLEIAEMSCRVCHPEIAASLASAHDRGGRGLSCVACHSDVGHLE